MCSDNAEYWVNHAGTRFVKLKSGRYRLNDSLVINCVGPAPLDLMFWAIENGYAIRGVINRQMIFKGA